MKFNKYQGGVLGMDATLKIQILQYKMFEDNDILTNASLNKDFRVSKDAYTIVDTREMPIESLDRVTEEFLHEIFALYNIGDIERNYRSLSCGDIVRVILNDIDGEASIDYMCMGSGWKALFKEDYI